jgi:anti-sigma factor RsiW
VNHTVLATQVDAWLDGELASVEAGELESHLAQCPECARYRDERLELRAAIRSALPTFEASDALRNRVRLALRTPAAKSRPHPSSLGWRWVALAASLVVVAFGSWQLALQHAAAGVLADEVLRSHVRSLMPGHLTDVLSSDQHTVKPWFDGVLDYSPPVYDFAGRGYPLIGGRLEYLAGRPVATLVYGRRKHLISVLVWPSGRGASGGSPGFRQGFHLLHWTTPDYVYWVASDLGIAELTELSRLIQQSDSAAAATGP